MLSIFFATTLLSFSPGCQSDFGLEAMADDPVAADEDLVFDTAAPWDTEAAPPEDTEYDWPEEEEEEVPPKEEDAPPEEDPPDEDDCDETSDLVYVIDRDTEMLYLFDPETFTLELLGELDCDIWSSPASMGVARNGFAYVRTSDDSVYEVRLADMQCMPTDYRDSSTGFGSFGMGYATDSAATWRDTLYVSNDRSVARLDTLSWDLTLLGSLPSQAELTGNADGELWAFLPLETPAQLVQLDKESGEQVESLGMPGFPDPYDIDTFAFATWGGDFWLFVRTSGMGSSTDVYQVSRDGTMTLARANIGINVVGAGVSTCAPTD